MSVTVPIGEAKTRLSELLRRVEAGEEVVIRRGSTPIARLVAVRPARILPPGSTGASGRLADDFDAPLDEFAEYRPPARDREPPAARYARSALVDHRR